MSFNKWMSMDKPVQNRLSPSGLKKTWILSAYIIIIKTPKHIGKTNLSFEVCDTEWLHPLYLLYLGPECIIYLRSDNQANFERNVLKRWKNCWQGL